MKFENIKHQSIIQLATVRNRTWLKTEPLGFSLETTSAVLVIIVFFFSLWWLIVRYETVYYSQVKWLIISMFYWFGCYLLLWLMIMLSQPWSTAVRNAWLVTVTLITRTSHFTFLTSQVDTGLCIFLYNVYVYDEFHRLRTKILH